MKKSILIFLILACQFVMLNAQDKGEVGINESLLNQRKKWLETYKTNYPGIFQKNISNNTELFFLFTYLPISDIISNNELFFQKQINTARLTREKTTWGKTIPDIIFKQYVLNPLIYNEKLDTFRLFAYNDLFDKICTLSINDAIIEVGYWCRMHVIANPQKSNFGNPLASLNAKEVSYLDAAIFQVSTLRAVGIPARLGYIPALAHTDGEFYFIEAWINEKWTFIPVNEPRKTLEQSWAKAIVERSLASYTRIIGNDQMNENTEINTSHYQVQNIQKQYSFQTKIKITVYDTAKKPVSNAPVSIMIIKNASIFPLITKTTNNEGSCYFYTGSGLFTAFSAQGDFFSFAFINTNQEQDYTINLTNHLNKNLNYVFNIIPPPEKYGVTKVNPITEDEKTKIYTCDTIRNNDKNSKKLCIDVITNNNIDGKNINVIEKSGNNCAQIAKFIKENKSSNYIMDYLDVLSPKVLYTSSASNLNSMMPSGDNIKTQKSFYSDVNYKNYILNPQLSDELITPWRSYFEKKYTDLEKKALNDIKVLINYVKTNIILIPDIENYSSNPISPIDVDKLKIADKYSRDLYFIALCRTFGIPAQYSFNFDKPLIFDGSDWKTVCIENGDLCVENYSATLVLLEEKDPITTIKYGTNYSFLKYQDNTFKSFSVKKFNKPGDSPREFKLEQGLYASVSLSRTPSNTTTFNLNFFKMENNIVHGGLFFPKNNTNKNVYSRIEADNSIQINTSPPKSLSEFSENNGAIIMYLNPIEYSSISAICEIIDNYSYYPQWNGHYLIIVPENMLNFVPKHIIEKLPKNADIVEDSKGEVLQYLITLEHFDFSNYLPAFFIVNPQNFIIYFSNSYKTFIMDEFFTVLKDNEMLREKKTIINQTLPVFNKDNH